MEFKIFKDAVNKQFEKMSVDELFQTDVTKESMWETYLKSFPEGSNPIFRERTTHDCQCCKQFIRVCGNVVSIENGELVSIWDINIGGDYQIVADVMSALVKSHTIDNVFRHYEKTLGTDSNVQQTTNGSITWEHFYYKLPSKFVMNKDRIGKFLGEKRSDKEVFKRGMDEITEDALETVIELIEQNSLYRGAENLATVKAMLVQKKLYDDIEPDYEDNYCWLKSAEIGSYSRTRNTAIGTLLVDISNDIPLDDAVKMFESKVAPMNYKRPTALITKGMIKKAEEKVEELGISDSLPRRYATIEDITINNILFANRDTKKSMNVFDELVEATPEKLRNFDKVEEVDIKVFIENILPKAESIEILLENKHLNNFVSLIAPKNDAPNILKWGNNFSWSYAGEVTDSIKERVKKAGGNVNGVLRCSLSWFNYDDLDIHVVEPNGNEIYYGNCRKPNISMTSGQLDVDMNAMKSETRNGVENIVWTCKESMLEGIYGVGIHQYAKRESVDVGFDAEIEYDGVIHSFGYKKALRQGEVVEVAKFNFSHTSGIEFISSLPSTQSAKEFWGITTNNFQKVKVIMNSPNHWDTQKTGNKHYFFMLENCKNPSTSRGFYNEFLSNELNEHRKVFEVLGSKMKVKESNEQLSGVGFSSTQRNQVVCKVAGSFTKWLKSIFKKGERKCLKKPLD